MSLTTTAAPLRVRSSANARPSSPPAPVTTTTRVGQAQTAHARTSPAVGTPMSGDEGRQPACELLHVAHRDVLRQRAGCGEGQDRLDRQAVRKIAELCRGLLGGADEQVARGGRLHVALGAAADAQPARPPLVEGDRRRRRLTGARRRVPSVGVVHVLHVLGYHGPVALGVLGHVQVHEPAHARLRRIVAARLQALAVGLEQLALGAHQPLAEPARTLGAHGALEAAPDRYALLRRRRQDRAVAPTSAGQTRSGPRSCAGGWRSRGPRYPSGSARTPGAGSPRRARARSGRC